MDGQGGGLADPRSLGPEALEGLLAGLAPDRDAAAGEHQRLHRRLLLVAYYSAARSSNRAWRVELAASRGLSLNALRILALRAREALRESLALCLAGKGRP